jgi:hypothetical protein
MAYPFYGTSLLRAINKGKTDVFKFLLDNGANTIAKTPGPKVMTALELVRTPEVSDNIRKVVEEIGER